jgi:hypothetical protein
MLVGAINRGDRSRAYGAKLLTEEISNSMFDSKFG